MKALIIENQYQKDPEIDGLIKDHPDLFSDVKVITGSIHRKPEELFAEVRMHDALIISSTFMHKDQLEDMAELLAGIANKKIFVRNLDSKIEEWTDENAILHFADHGGFLENIKDCIDRHEVYSFEEDWDSREIKDEVWERMPFGDSTGRGTFNIKAITEL